MYSVTQRIRMIKQPRGGYLNRKEFAIHVLEDGVKLNEEENIHPGLVGLAVDYMTRFLMGTPSEEAFQISLKGAKIAKDDFNAYKLLSKVNGLDFESLTNACKLVGYDVCFRAGMTGYKPVEEINPDSKTIDNLVTMIKRSLSFWKQYGPIVKDGFTFEGGYTRIISAGDGDYLTNDTLWDFKVSKEEIRPIYTLQLLVYYIMGQHSIHREFNNIKKLGIYNPRLNKIYTIDVCNISENIIDTVSQKVIGYGLSKEEYREIVRKDTNKSIIAQKEKQRQNEPEDDLDKEIYGYSSKKEYISKAFPTRVKISNYSIFEKPPVFWNGDKVPTIVDEKNLIYVIRFKARFKIKKGKTPFVMNKISYLYSLVEPLRTSDVYDSKTKRYYESYIDFNGRSVKSRPILILTSDDFQLFNEVYDVKELEILDGCYFL